MEDRGPISCYDESIDKALKCVNDLKWEEIKNYEKIEREDLSTKIKEKVVLINGFTQEQKPIYKRKGVISLEREEIET